VPLTTGGLRLFGQRFLRTITVAVDDVELIDETQQAVTALLQARHQTSDFQIRNMASILDAATETQDTLTILLGSIAAISLVVGGIGVMNIMLVSVTERTREIGIRMAIGARRIHVLLQFLVEAVLLSVIGGGLGVLCGGILSRVISSLADWPTLLSPAAMIGAFLFSGLVGVFFGFYPARRASLLNPIEALRFE
jgi:ABC-type antimicrobial peptide transport system permease subunit